MSFDAIQKACSGSASDIRKRKSRQYVDENKFTDFPRNKEHSNKSDCLISIEND